jgi:hypothetical protein
MFSTETVNLPDQRREIYCLDAASTSLIGRRCLILPILRMYTDDYVLYESKLQAEKHRYANTIGIVLTESNVLLSTHTLVAI